MEIPKQALEQLAKLTANTADQELTCEESGELVHRYVEFRVSGSGPLPQELTGVEQHLTVCPDCKEIVDAVISAIVAESSSPPAKR